MYEVFEHTADLGLRMRAASVEELFSEAGVALFSVIVANLDAVEPVQWRELCIEGDERDYLLFDWLNELLYLFEHERLLLSRFRVQLSDAGLTAIVHGEPADRARHQLEHEVKAITYHELKIVEDHGGWLAEVIVDI